MLSFLFIQNKKAAKLSYRMSLHSSYVLSISAWWNLMTSLLLFCVMYSHRSRFFASVYMFWRSSSVIVELPLRILLA